MPEIDPFLLVDVMPEAFAFIQALADPSIPSHQRERLIKDHRIVKPCEACGHPGYTHEHAEAQYDRGFYGVEEWEAGDIVCEAEGCDGCGWYEGDNWQKRR